MTEFQLPCKLRHHRPLLLALEAIGWLHMTGKARVDFLRSHGGQNNYDYMKWHEQENPPFPWNNLLKWVQDDFDLKSEFSLSNDPWSATLTDFLTKHAKRNKGILGLLQAGHGIASGIEKNLPKSTSEYLGQDVTHMWLSTAFGQSVRNLLADPPDLLTETGWKRLLERIEELLAGLKRLGDNASPNDFDGWWRWREHAVGRDGWLRKAFSGTLAETRLPNNDVTLFDQSYVAAALFKSAAAGAILEGSLFPWDNTNLKQQTRWRLLTVGIGADHYESRAVKIGDWSGARLALDSFFREVRKLVEVDLALGSLLYADGAVCVFSFPGERRKHQGGDLQIEEWVKCLQDSIDSYAREHKLETPPWCSISDPSRALVGMTAEIRKARNVTSAPLHRDWKTPCKDGSGGHICPVCLVRESKSEKDKQSPCKPCKERREHRLDSWLREDFGSDTVWLTEAADANDRLALVTMSLDIEPWLDGSRLDSLRAQAIAEWRKYNPELIEFWERNEGNRKKELNPVKWDRPFDSLLKEIGQRFKTFDGDDLLLVNLQEGYRHEKQKNDPRSDDEIWKSYFSKIVDDRIETVEDSPNAPKWENLRDDSERAEWLTHQFFRKLASPGRIYRFQRQAEDFFRALFSEFRGLAAADQNRWRTRRLVIKPGNGSSGPWKNHEVYNGRHRDAPVSLLYRRQSKDFLTICNLSRLLKPAEQAKDILCGITLDLKSDEGTEKRQLRVGSVTDDAEALGVYHPVVKLELSPLRFRVLLPLEATSACVDRAVEAWNAEFARVRDRLTLRVGVVAFPRKTPFQAVIEATRTIEDDFHGAVKPETWRVEGTETREGVAAFSLVPPDGRHELQTVPVRLPDGREDVFYPYFAVEDKQLRFALDFQHPGGRTYRHVRDLRSGDGVLVYPPLIATLFMDGTAGRFQDVKKRRLMEWKEMQDIWRLIEDLAPGRTALRGAWSELVERREAWQGPDSAWLEGGQEAWLDLVRVVFHQRLGVRSPCLETLVKAARDGLLDCCLKWHMSVLKKQVPGGDR